MGGEYMVERKDELENWAPYGKVKPIPANLRNYLGMLDVMAGKGPIFMETDEAMQKIADQYKDDPKAYKKKMKELESEAWEDFLDMTISQAHLWAATNVRPEEKPSEIAACEPYFIGSHSGASGAWISGSEDLQTEQTKGEYFWGAYGLCTTPRLFAAGDSSGASSHKFSSGSHAEGRIVGKAMVKWILENNLELPTVSDATIEALMAETLKPLDVFAAHKAETTDPNINPNYIRPRQFMFRLQKIMDEYAGGVSASFSTNTMMLNRAMELLTFLREDSEKLGAEGVYELERCWENIHRMDQAESHVRTILAREETRWPGYYFRSDMPKMDDENWKLFVNVKRGTNGEWEVIKRPIYSIID
jgi:adenylylsulfate reductase subunit A